VQQKCLVSDRGYTNQVIHAQEIVINSLFYRQLFVKDVLDRLIVIKTLVETNYTPSVGAFT